MPKREALRMKKLLALLLCAIIAVSSSGCIPIRITLYPATDEQIIERESKITKFGFSNSDDDKFIEEVLTADELRNWENPYGKYSSYVLYKSLSNRDEKLIYKALEYAMVNSYKKICIDDKLGVRRSAIESIAQFLSLDTPFLEQNLMMIVVENVANFYNYKAEDGRDVSVLLRCSAIYLKNFTEELWESKMEALREAEKIYKELDCGEEGIELAEKIYRYVATSIEYKPYESDEGIYQGNYAPFLYDALITKKTHCDGFTNALSLLYSIAGFEQVEKNIPGHTFNCVKIEGKWYNMDATWGSLIPDNATTMGAGPYFAFPTYLQNDKHDFFMYYPTCRDGYYMDADATLKSCSDDDFFTTACKAFKSHNNEWTMILVEHYDKDEFIAQVQKLSDYLDVDIVYSASYTIYGKIILYIINDEVYD